MSIFSLHIDARPRDYGTMTCDHDNDCFNPKLKLQHFRKSGHGHCQRSLSKSPVSRVKWNNYSLFLNTYLRTCFIPILATFIIILNSCSTDVDFYADYKDVAIIYALLDYRADTNYVKITRAFCGSNDDPIDANKVALIADSSNYPGKLDARLIELKSTHGNHYEPTGRILPLDTLTIHNKEEGTFYAPYQKVYFTKERLYTGSLSRYKYQLVVIKPDHDTVTAQTNLVGNEDFYIMSSSANFQIKPSQSLGKITFRADGIAPVYEINMQFNYLEQHTGQEMKHKHVIRSFGVQPLSNYNKIDNTENAYYQEYSVNWLFNSLENAIGNDTIVNFNHPNVVRYIDSFVVTIYAAGDALLDYILINEAELNSLKSFVSSYTNVNGGYGLFSSRTTIKKEITLSASTKRDLFAKSSWGFKEH